MTLNTSSDTMSRLRGHQTNAATNIANSDSFQKLEGKAELGNIVKNTHGTISTASFAGVRAALTNRGTASTRLKTESVRLTGVLGTADTNYKSSDNSSAKNVAASIPPT
jgi:hypothetical protein